MKLDKDKLRDNLRAASALADSWLDKAYLWMAARPAPVTLLITVGVAVSLLAVGALLRGGCQ